jgi:TRAP-type C4-dicarboxylate transport system permease small subunit
MLPLLKRIDRRLARLEDLLIIAMMAILAVVLGVGVVLRYVFNNPLTWSEELVVTIFVWMVMLGVPSALRSKMHIRIDVLILRLSNSARRTVGYLAYIAGLVVFIASVYAGFTHTVGVWGSHTPMLGFSMGWTFIAMPIGFALTLFHGTVILLEEGAERVFQNATETVIDSAEV